MVALVAVMRKLLHAVFGMFKHDALFDGARVVRRWQYPPAWPRDIDGRGRPLIPLPQQLLILTLTFDRESKAGSFTNLNCTAEAVLYPIHQV